MALPVDQVERHRSHTDTARPWPVSESVHGHPRFGMVFPEKAHPQLTLLVMLLAIRVEWKQCNIKVVPDYGLPCAPRFFCSCSLRWLVDSYPGTPREQHSGLRKFNAAGPAGSTGTARLIAPEGALADKTLDEPTSARSKAQPIQGDLQEVSMGTGHL